MNRTKTTRTIPTAASSEFRNPQSAFRNGFTLMELLIAIGIMAVGGAMAAALFPAAIKENQSSYNDTLGTIICENGLAMVKARLTDPLQNSGSPSTDIGILIDEIGGLTAFDMRYPTQANDADSKQGYRIVARRPSASINSYEIFLFAFQMTDNYANGHYVTVEFDSAGISADGTVATASDGSLFPLGTLVVLGSDHTVSRVAAKNGNNLTLDPKAPTVGGTQVLWTVVERDISNAIVNHRAVMNVLVARTALRAN